MKSFACCLLLMLAACGNESKTLIILVSLDTTRADALGIAGARLPDGNSPTPVIDALARDGTYYEEAFSPVPLTLPAHVTMLSGLYPDRHGVRDNDTFKLPAAVKRTFRIVPEILRGQGYDTAAFVSAEPLERRHGLDAGFRVYDQPDRASARGGGQGFRERDALITTARAIEWLKGGTEPRRFLFLHFFEPHRPYELHEGGPKVAPGERGAYMGEVAHCDRAIGELLASLPDKGASAWVIVTGDHGEGLGDRGEATHGFLLHDSTLRVPLVIRPPVGTPRTVPRPARLADLAPTILDAAKVGLPAMDGKSLIREVESTFVDRAETLYGWHQFRYARLRAIRDSEYKLVEGGGREDLTKWRGTSTAQPDALIDSPLVRDRLRGELLRALLAPGSERGEEMASGAESFGPYIGSRAVGSAVEPTEDQNRSLPRVADRWNTVEDLEEARGALRSGNAPKALRLLKAHADERATNPALLFWTARAARESAAAEGLTVQERRDCLMEADGFFAELGERFHDPRGEESRLLVARDVFRVAGDRAGLKDLSKRATGLIAVGRGTALVFALRAYARSENGDMVGAESDLIAALAIDPEDPRIVEDLRVLRGKKPPQTPSAK